MTGIDIAPDIAKTVPTLVSFPLDLARGILFPVGAILAVLAIVLLVDGGRKNSGFAGFASAVFLAVALMAHLSVHNLERPSREAFADTITSLEQHYDVELDPGSLSFDDDGSTPITALDTRTDKAVSLIATVAHGRVTLFAVQESGPGPEFRASS